MRIDGVSKRLYAKVAKTKCSHKCEMQYVSVRLRQSRETQFIAWSLDVELYYRVLRQYVIFIQ